MPISVVDHAFRIRKINIDTCTSLHLYTIRGVWGIVEQRHEAEKVAGAEKVIGDGVAVGQQPVDFHPALDQRHQHAVRIPFMPEQFSGLEGARHEINPQHPANLVRESCIWKLRWCPAGRDLSVMTCSSSRPIRLGGHRRFFENDRRQKQRRQQNQTAKGEVETGIGNTGKHGQRLQFDKHQDSESRRDRRKKPDQPP